jgi:CubicO group peptidase (beta-lactamase class C family)
MRTCTFDNIHYGNALTASIDSAGHFLNGEWRKVKGPRGNWDHTLAEVVAMESQMKLLSEPALQWRYSNAAIATLERIIEVVSRQPFEKFIHDRIFEPLAMKDTFYFLPMEKRNRLAAVYTDDDGVLKRFSGDRFARGRNVPLPKEESTPPQRIWLPFIR